MRRIVFLLLVVVITGCTGINEVPPPGNYLVIPVTQTFSDPDFSYCSAGDCWNALMQQAIPTQEEFPVPSPIPTSSAPTPTPPQPVYICPLGTTGVNVRPVASTSSTPLFTLQPGQRMLLATSLKFDWYEVVYRGTAAYIHKSVSTECATGVLIS